MSSLLQFKAKSPSVKDKLSAVERRVWAILEVDRWDAEMLAEMFDVSTQTVRNIKMLKTKRAKAVKLLMDADGTKSVTWAPARRFTEQETAAIRASSASSAALAKQYDCSPSTIRMVKTWKTYVS